MRPFSLQSKKNLEMGSVHDYRDMEEAAATTRVFVEKHQVQKKHEPFLTEEEIAELRELDEEEEMME